MGFFNVLGKFQEKREMKKAASLGISETKFQEYQTEKKKRLFRLEQRLKREREEKALKQKYKQPKPTLRTAIKKPMPKRVSSSAASRFGLVRDPLASDKPNPWTTEPKEKKRNPWLD